MQLENIVFQDKVKSSPIVIAALALSAVMVVIIAVVLYFQEKLFVDNAMAPILIVVTILNVAILMLFRQMQIVITDKEVRFGFYFFKKRIALPQIEKAEIEDFKFSNYYGYGIRYGLNNTIGYVPSGGKGIKLTLKNDRRKYFFICNRAEEVLTLLKQYGR